MIQRTLGQVRPQIAAVSGATGMPVTSALVVQGLNNAIEELMNEGNFPGVVDRWHFDFDETTGLVALPYFLDRLMQVTIDDCPRQIVSPWYEFVAYGPGQLRDKEFDAFGNERCARRWYDVVADRGEMPVVTPIPAEDGPWVLRLYSTVAEEDPCVVNIQGLDPDGLIVRSISNGTGGEAGEWMSGIDLELSNGTGSYVESAQAFSKITAVVKPETNGYVRLTAWNGVTEVELSNYAFNETTPSYRHYFIPALYRGEQGDRSRVILARCRRRFVPVAEDDDVLIIGNLAALQGMVIAQYKRSIGKWDDYVAQKKTAVEIMRNESLAYHGKARVPSISFQRGVSIGVMPGLR